MIILTENISWVIEQVLNQCIFTKISNFEHNHGIQTLDVDQIFITTANIDGDNPCQFSE